VAIKVENLGRWFKTRTDSIFSGSGSGVDADNAASFIQSNADLGLLPQDRSKSTPPFSLWNLLGLAKRLYWQIFDEKRTRCTLVTASGVTMLWQGGPQTPSSSLVIHSLRIQSESATPVTAIITFGDSTKCEPLRFRLAGDGTGFSEQFRLGSEPQLHASLDLRISLSVAAPVSVTWCQSYRHDDPAYQDTLTNY
jgi:hypothetical protein